MTILKYIFLISSLLVSCGMLGQEKQLDWIQNMGGSERDEATCIQPTSDGGLVVAGYTYSKDGLLTSNEGWQDGWLIKTNSEGHLEWQRRFGGNGADVIEEVVEIADGYVICGWSSSTVSNFVTSNGLEDGFVAKLNKSGDIIWKKSFGGTLMDKFFDLDILSNGDVAVVGYLMSPEVTLTNADHHGLLDIWVVKLSASGQLIWQKAYGGSDDDFAYNILRTEDDKLVIAGSTDSMDGQVGVTVGEWDCWLIKIDANGELEWKQKFGYSNNEEVSDLISYNKNYFVIGSSNSAERKDAHGNSDAWVLQVDHSGNIIGDYSYGSEEKDCVHSAIATPEGIYISGESEFNDSKDGWLMQIDGNGSILQSQYIGGSDYDLLNDITYRDNAIYITGSSYSSDGDMTQNFGESDALVAKLGTGNTPHDYNIKVFPNPASNHLTIVLDKIGIERVSIFNSVGQVVHSMNANNFFQEQIDVSAWTSGVYTIEVLSNNELVQTQFVKL